MERRVISTHEEAGTNIFVSIVGSSYLNPIIDLSEKLLTTNISGKEGKVSSRENGYSVSIIILLVAMMESFIVRLRYLQKREKSKSTYDLPGEIYPDYDKTTELTEVFVVRNAIIHNHFWQIKSDMNEEIDFGKLDIYDGGSHSLYKKVVDMNTRKTKNMSISIVPTKIGLYDVIKVFEIITDTLCFLDKKDNRLGYFNGTLSRKKLNSTIASLKQNNPYREYTLLDIPFERKNCI